MESAKWSPLLPVLWYSGLGLAQNMPSSTYFARHISADTMDFANPKNQDFKHDKLKISLRICYIFSKKHPSSNGFSPFSYVHPTDNPFQPKQINRLFQRFFKLHRLPAGPWHLEARVAEAPAWHPGRRCPCGWKPWKLLGRTFRPSPMCIMNHIVFQDVNIGIYL